jgi:hypothetical protein
MMRAEGDGNGTDENSKSSARADELPIEERYRAASNELNQRLNLRQISYLGHAAAAAAILKLFFDIAQKPDDPPANPFKFILLLLCPSIINFAFGCWIRSQDLTVGMLGTFCRMCEEHPADLLSWHSNDQGWQTASMKHREWTEIAYTVLNVLLAEVPTLFIIQAKDWKFPSTFMLVLCINHFVLGLTCWMILSIKDYRSRLMTWTFENGKLSESPGVFPSPPDLMAFVGIVGAFGTVTGRWLGKIHPTLWNSSVPSFVILLISIALRIWAYRMDSGFWRNRGSKQLTSEHKWYAAYWLVPILIILGAVILLTVGHLRSNNTEIHVALFASILLMGYSVPETLLCWYRLRESWFGPVK